MEIASQRQLRAHGQPDFCYLCGEVLDGSVRTNRDHCPPKAFFATPDRENFPILLPTHETCNNKWHKTDEIISIVADALHTKNKSQNAALTRKLDAKKVQMSLSSFLCKRLLGQSVWEHDHESIACINPVVHGSIGRAHV